MKWRNTNKCEFPKRISFPRVHFQVLCEFWGGVASRPLKQQIDMHSRASIENQSLTWQPLFWHHHPNKMLWIKGFWWFSSECYLLFEFNVFLNVFLVLILGTYCSIPFLFLFPSRTNFQSYIFQAFFQPQHTAVFVWKKTTCHFLCAFFNNHGSVEDGKFGD